MADTEITTEQSLVPVEKGTPDGFSRALETMQRNGTDEQTIRTYRNILDIIHARQPDFQVTPDENGPQQSAAPIAETVAGYLNNPRLDVVGLPIISAEHPENPTFVLRSNYHNRTLPEMIVLVNDASIRSIQKPDGTLNQVMGIQIVPGDEQTPGDMVEVFSKGKTRPLSPVLQEQVANAFQVAHELSLPTGHQTLGDLANEWRLQDGSKLLPQHLSEKGITEPINFCQVILGGFVVRAAPIQEEVKTGGFLQRLRSRLLGSGQKEVTAVSVPKTLPPASTDQK